MTPGKFAGRRAAAWLVGGITVLATLAVLALPLGLAAPSAAARAARAQAAAPGQRVVMILLDTNNSPPADRLHAERRAALAYARALPADVEAGLVTFSSAWKIILGPTTNRGILAAAITAAPVAGPTSGGLSGALTAAAAELTRLGARGGRLLVLSNGEFIERNLRAVAFPIDVVSWYSDNDDFPGRVRAVAAASGGQIASPRHVAALAKAFPAQPRPRPHPAKSSSVASPAATSPAAAPAWRFSVPLAELLAGIFAVLLVLSLFGIGAVRPGRKRSHLIGQIERYGPMSAPAQAAPGNGKVAQAAVGMMRQLLQARDTEPRLAMRLDNAGISRQPAEWALIGASISVALAATLSVLTGKVLIGVLAGFAIGWLCMRLFLSIKISRRRAAFDEQLPNVLQLVAGSLQTGFSLAQAIDAVVREAGQPAAGEFSRALAETRLGVDLEVGLEGVAERMNSTDLRWVVMAIRIQRETGGNLAEVLRNTVATMRERAFLRRQVRLLSAEGRLSAYILLALPVFVGGWLFYSSPDYMRPLYTTGFGVLMLSVACLLVVIGAFWMRKLINVGV